MQKNEYWTVVDKNGKFSVWDMIYFNRKATKSYIKSIYREEIKDGYCTLVKVRIEEVKK